MIQKDLVLWIFHLAVTKEEAVQKALTVNITSNIQKLKNCQNLVGVKVLKIGVSQNLSKESVTTS